MIMLRIRPLVTTLILSALMMGAFANGIAAAKSHGSSVTSTSSISGVPRPNVGPFSGEPDNTGTQAPVTYKTAAGTPVELLPGTLAWWTYVTMKVLFGQQSRKH